MTNTPSLTFPDRHLIFTSQTFLPPPLLAFYSETYTLFTSLQRIVASSFRMPAVDSRDRKDVLGPPGAETVGHMRRLVGMYLEEILKLREAPELDVSFAVV